DFPPPPLVRGGDLASPVGSGKAVRDRVPLRSGVMIERIRGNQSPAVLAAGLRCTFLAILLWAVLAPPFANTAWARPTFSAIAVDARSGKILFSRDPDALTHPASLTKVMTLYILFGELRTGKVKLDTAFKVSKAASAKAPSKLGLKPGDTISVEDAIKAIVTRSANDVAATIAENLSSSESAFAGRMTSVAHDLGMLHTVFHNASGLPDPRQVTTARDIATLSLRIQRDFPQYYPYFRTMAFTYRGQVIKTHNRLLGHYAGADGIKTGYVAASGFNLTSSAKRGDKRVVGVVMGASSATSRNLYMMAMLDKAFPKCKDGTAIAVAVEGVKPKSEPGQVEEAEATPPPLKKTTGKAKKATAPPVPAKSDDEDAAEEEGGNETSGVEKPVERASAEAQDTQEAPADPPVGQTVLSKTSPDGTPLPFAVKKPGDD